MSSIMIRGRYVLCKVIDPMSAVVVQDGAVFERGGEIIEVGKYDVLRARHTADETIGSQSHLVIPGLVNSHFHVGLTPFQRGVPDLPLELWVPAIRGARGVDPYLDNLYGAAQMIQAGTTTVHAMPVVPAQANLQTVGEILKAYQESGMRVCCGALVSNQNHVAAGPKGGDEAFLSELPGDLRARLKSFMTPRYLATEEYLSNLEEIFSKYNHDRYQRVRMVVAPGGVHNCSDDFLLALKQLAVKHNIGMNIHLQETIYQTLYGIRTWGKTPLQHLNDIGLLGRDVTCSHGVWLTDEDMEVIVAKGANVCHLASSNLRLQSGIAPLNRLLAKGVRVCIGTDEAGINDDKDLFQEMRLVLKLHREPRMENASPTSHQVFQMATVNGAQALGFGDRIGTLEPGKQADMVLVNLENIAEPYLDSKVGIVDALVHRGRAADVDTVMIGGKIVLRDHKLISIDTEALYRELKKSLSQPQSPRELEASELSRQLEPYLRRFYAGETEGLTSPHYFYNARSW